MLNEWFLEIKRHDPDPSGSLKYWIDDEEEVVFLGQKLSDGYKYMWKVNIYDFMDQ